MATTAAVGKDELRGIFDVDHLSEANYMITIAPISRKEASEIEFKSLKGIAGRPLDLDEVRRERLGL